MNSEVHFDLLIPKETLKGFKELSSQKWHTYPVGYCTVPGVYLSYHWQAHNTMNISSATSLSTPLICIRLLEQGSLPCCHGMKIK